MTDEISASESSLGFYICCIFLLVIYWQLKTVALCYIDQHHLLYHCFLQFSPGFMKCGASWPLGYVSKQPQYTSFKYNRTDINKARSKLELKGSYTFAVGQDAMHCLF